MGESATLVLTLSGLVLAALAAAAAGERLGAPLLLLFLAVGLLAGPEGPGGLVIADTGLAAAGAAAALGVILLDGGLRTRPEVFALGWRPGVVLATLGVIVTAGVTAVAAFLALDIGWAEAALVGAIVSSTDAAAVFAVLGVGGAALVRARLAATLETESGFNDPLAVVLVTVLAAVLAGEAPSSPGAFASYLAWQGAGGILFGLGGGWLAGRLRPSLRLGSGLAPVYTLASGLFVFSAANAAGASGFLAVYLCGLVQARRLGESEAKALDGFAWLAQIGLFLILGLLASPSHLLAVAGPALLVGLALVFLARPLAVFVSLAPFGFSVREMVFAAWAGLRGATPIFLGLVPVVIGAPNANLFFSVAFAAVALSLVLQGWTTRPAARWLEVGEGGRAEEPLRLGWARAGAAGLALTVAFGAAYWIAHDLAPARAVLWRPADVADLEARLTRNPSDIAEALPPDWDSLDPERRQRLFVAVLTPIVEAEMARIAAERAEVERIRTEAAARPSGVGAMGDQGRRDVLARRYGVRFDDLDELQRRVDGAPVSLAVAHAALSTGWGGSEAARSSNALFGMTPGQDASRYPSLSASVAAWLSTLNTHRDFAAFRAARAEMRAAGAPFDGLALAPTLAPFDRNGPQFTASLEAVITSNSLGRLDSAAP